MRDSNFIYYKNTIAVTNRHLCTCPLTEQLKKVCSVHPRAIILREKDLSEEAYLSLAKEALTICAKENIPCILHNFIDVAADLQVNAIHLPLQVLRENRQKLSGFSIIGTSVHSLEDAFEAVSLGATYLSAGHIYATDCKKGLPPRGLDFLQQVCEHVKVPVYAIGGIKANEKQFQEIMAHGAKGGCIMSGMMQL